MILKGRGEGGFVGKMVFLYSRRGPFMGMIFFMGLGSINTFLI